MVSGERSLAGSALFGIEAVQPGARSLSHPGRYLSAGRLIVAAQARIRHAGNLANLLAPGATRLLRCALLLHLSARGATEAVQPSRRQSTCTWDPGSLGATGQRDHVDHAVLVLHVVWYSDQDGTLSDAGHKAQSLAETIIGCWLTVDCGQRLLVRRFGAKII
jgi:hypothetical protein